MTTPAQRAAESLARKDYLKGVHPDAVDMPDELKERILELTARFIEAEYATEAANPQVGTCCICGSAIWHKEARLTDERGTFHPICAQTQKAAQLLTERRECVKVMKMAADELEFLSSEPTLPRQLRELIGKMEG